ncbi:hypothetical protein, partial [Candidatus Symbiopectobacterium sp. NZEC135]|uniref:hypothetical protein n=1 Tax=Candidatus Symbiopectobacterium sp. NZEC135 TaxID=2820471 RepID=UPI002226C69E
MLKTLRIGRRKSRIITGLVSCDFSHASFLVRREWCDKPSAIFGVVSTCTGPIITHTGCRHAVIEFKTGQMAEPG